MKKVVIGMLAMLLSGSTALAHAEESGASLYKANCASCHGATGDANTPAGRKFKAASFSSSGTLKKYDAALLVVARNGKGQMPPWGDVLTDAEIQRVIAYIRTFQKKE